ncbi:hypothetical protein [Gimesia alba]|nr:hypothetical protein [Gimesia alba]
MAFDTVCVLRYSRRLSSEKLQNLAALIDFGACANDLFDEKGFSREEYQTTRRLLESAEISGMVDEYLGKLRRLEDRRPTLNGDDQVYHLAQTYRESVIRLSLGTIAATALGNLTIEDGIQATYYQEDLKTLFRIVMLCQIIDDIFDFAKDKEDGLPGFLTAHASPYQALRLTSDAARYYADRRGLPSSPHMFPFRIAMLGISVIANVAIMYGYCRLKWYAFRNWSTWIKEWHASTDTHS